MSDSPNDFKLGDLLQPCLDWGKRTLLFLSWPGRTQCTDEIASRFASNQRSENDLLKVKSHLEEILETLKGYTAASSLRLTASVLKKIVAFNRPRLQNYVKHLCEETQKCLDTSNISTELSEKLEELRDMAMKANNRELEEGKCE